MEPRQMMSFIALKSCKLGPGRYLTEGEIFQADQEMEEKLRILYEKGCIDTAHEVQEEEGDDLDFEDMEEEEDNDDPTGAPGSTETLSEPKSESTAKSEAESDPKGASDPKPFVPLPQEEWRALSSEQKKEYAALKKAHEDAEKAKEAASNS